MSHHIHCSKGGVSRRDGVSELAHFLVNDKAAQTDFWYKTRILPWVRFDAILVILFICYSSETPSYPEPRPYLTHVHNAHVTLAVEYIVGSMF